MNALLPHDLAMEKNPDYPLMDMLVLSHSSLSSFHSCARKLEFRQFYGTPHEREDNYAGDVGNAIHRGFGTWLATEDETEALFEFACHFPYELEFLKAGQSTRSFEAAFGTCEALINSSFLRQFKVIQIETLNHGKRFGIEVPFALQITGSPMPIPVWFVGYVDCVLYSEHKDQFIVTDLKTTRQWSDDPSAKFQFDQQTIPYGIVLEHMLGRTIEEMTVAYLYTYIDVTEMKVKLLEFKRTMDDLLDWKRGLFETVDRIAAFYKNSWSPRASNGDTCVSFNRPCQFHEICCYRRPDVLGRIIQGKKRETLFSTGDEAWIVAELPYERLAR